jgi:hypothetical protein
VPWCSDCDRFLSPSTVQKDGTCPSCGRPVDTGAAGPTKLQATEDALPPVPWHLKLLALAVALYLGYRLFQAIGWVFG